MMYADGFGQGRKDGSLGSGLTPVELDLPVLEFFQAFVRVHARLIGKVVGCSCKGIDAVDVGAKCPRNQTRTDREVFVVRAGKPFAICIGFGERKG